MRAFTAVDIEDREVLENLTRVRDEVDYNFKTVPEEKMHITLQFFQNAEEKQLEEVIDALKAVEKGRFQAEIKGLGVFPSKEYVRVVWAGVDSRDIFDLKQQVSDHGVEEDNDHEFHPHVTLARVDSISRRDKKSFREDLERYENKSFGFIEVDKVKLFESRFEDDGTSYRVLEEVKL